MRSRSLGGMLALLVAAATLAPVPTSAGLAEDEAAIRELWKSYASANVAGDAETWLGLWDEGGLQLPPGETPRDKSMLIDTHPRRLEAMTYTSMSVRPEEIEVAGDWAYSRGTFSVDLLNNADGEQRHVEGKFMTIHRRQLDGSWKIYRDIFNTGPG